MMTSNYQLNKKDMSSGMYHFEQLPPAQVTVTEEVIINEVNDHES